MRTFFFFWVILVAFSCREKVQAPDVSQVDVSFEIFRTEDKIFSPDNKESLIMALEEIQKEHPSFYNVYFNHVFPVGPARNTDSLAMAILAFKQQPLADTLLKQVKKQYVDFKEINDELKKAFQYAKYYFPDKMTPDVYTLISEFGFQGFIFEGRGTKDALGIGLDMFLGETQNYKKIEPDNPGFSDYITRSWNRDHLVKKTLEIWLSDFVEPTKGNKMLDHMISNGKKMYILTQLLPEAPDSVITEYSRDAMDWVDKNELQMWSYFVEKNLLQESAPTTINKYINPSPDSPGMPREAPGRTGNYIGYKIVEKYMEKNETVTLEALASEVDAQKIFELSKYKPRRN